MNIAKLLLPCLALATALPAQSPQLLPSPAPFWFADNFPLGAPPIRYQQWFTAAQWTRTVGHPVRITGLDFFAATTGLGGPAVIDIEVTMGNGPAFVGVHMPSNLTNPFAAFPTAPVVVVPRGLHSLGASLPGTRPLQLSFVNEFVWDGESTVVVEVKMWDNGVGNVARSFDLLYAQNGGFEYGRMWGLSSDPDNVTNASIVQQGNVVAMQFHFAEGVSIPYGDGCPGQGGHIPMASTTGGLPVPANGAWTQVLSGANSQKNAVLLIGGSNTMFGAAPLPFDMSLIGGFGCELWASIDGSIPALTVGGGPGAGSAQVATPIPPVTGFTGLSVFFQWLVWDDQSANGVMSMSHGLQTIFG